jgi:XTP/dITP diphosphohydrolase
MLHKGDTLVIASHNQGKIREIQKLLERLELKLISATDLSIPEPEETGLTFTENSVLKATEVMKACQLPCLADDSGLCVEALNGAPGIYSARWAEKEDGSRDFSHAFHKIFSMLDPAQSYAAHMTCVLTLAFPEGSAHSFEGIVKGQISLPARGEYNFGYDPIFTPTGYSQTFAEMDRDLKSSLSHRRRAFDKLIQFLG